jgi:aromatic-L-amino-acid decarboxylase
VAAPSTTVLDGRTVIRAAIVNHRTTEADMDAFMEALQVSALRVLGAAAQDASVKDAGAALRAAGS